ncbi:MAG: type II toxin-antitoxin system RelE/ParE family toxin [Tepidisphaeraceae bacterium]
MSKPLKGTRLNLWRLQVGDYRVIYQIEDRQLLVLIIDIGNRKDVYRGL